MCNNSTIILKWSSLLGTSVMKKKHTKTKRVCTKPYYSGNNKEKKQ